MYIWQSRNIKTVIIQFTVCTQMHAHATSTRAFLFASHSVALNITKHICYLPSYTMDEQHNVHSLIAMAKRQSMSNWYSIRTKISWYSIKRLKIHTPVIEVNFCPSITITWSRNHLWCIPQSQHIACAAIKWVWPCVCVDTTDCFKISWNGLIIIGTIGGITEGIRSTLHVRTYRCMWICRWMVTMKIQKE